jgi:hypothetical protein
MKFIIALGKILVLGFAVGVISSLGKTSPHAAFFRWNGSLLIRCVGATILLVGIPASVCALTRRMRSSWLAVVILAGAMLIAPWVDMWSDHFKAANSGRVFTPSLDGTVWEPLILAAIMVIPMLLMRRFVPVFRRHEAVASHEG